MDIFEIPQLTKQMIQRLRQLHRSYDYNLMQEVVENKRNLLSKHFIDKGWNYCYAIIENSVTELYAKKKTEEREAKKIISQKDYIITLVDYQKQDNRDISEFLKG